MENFVGWITTIGIALGGVLLIQRASGVNRRGNTPSALLDAPALQILEYDDYEGDSRAFLFNSNEILSNYVRTYNRIRMQPGLNIDADRDYNGLNQIRYNVDKYDVVNGLR